MTQGALLRKGFLWGGAVVALMLLLAAYAWMHIPAGEPIATHWGLNGKPDGYGGKAFVLLFTPTVALFLLALFAVFVRLEPRRRHLGESAKAFTAIVLSLLGLLLVVHGHLIATALGLPLDIRIVAPASLGIMFMVMGNYFGKTRSNHFLGIRTPWTLSSDYAWDQTHRLGGKLFMLFGLLLLLSAPLRSAPLLLVLVLGEAIAITVLLSIYSYVAWRGDPYRRNGTAKAPRNTARTLRNIAAFSVAVVLSIALAAVHATR